MNSTPKRISLPKEKGSYILLIFLDNDITVKIGKLGTYTLTKGCYLYIGSALGPGGLNSRIIRHLSKRKKTHWHIDYLTKNMQVRIRYILYILSDNHLECNIVQTLIQYKYFKSIINGFGSSDCRKGCPSHFLKYNGDPKKCLEYTLKKLKNKFRIETVNLDNVQLPS